MAGSGKHSKGVLVPITLDFAPPHYFSDVDALFTATLTIVLAVVIGYIAILYNTHYLMDLLGSKQFLIGSIVIVLLIYILLLRKFPIKENTLKRLYLQTKENEVTDLSAAWDVYNISKDGLISFMCGVTGKLVQLSKGGILNLPDDYMDIHADCVCNFLNYMVSAGYHFDYLNLRVKEPNLKGLETTEASLNDFIGTPFYDIASAQIAAIRAEATELAESDREYYLFYTNQMQLAKNLDKNIRSAESFLGKSLYVEYHTLNPKECFDLQQSYFKFSYINVNNLLGAKFDVNAEEYLQVIDVAYEVNPDYVSTDNQDTNNLYNSDDIDKLVDDLVAVAEGKVTVTPEASIPANSVTNFSDKSDEDGFDL
jgi:hypothetical protein